MGCPVLNEDRIDLILRGTLPGPDRAQLIAHLAEPCEQCLNTLSGPAGDELLDRLATGKLDAAEADQVFAAAAQTVSPAAPTHAPSRAPRRPRWAVRVGRGAAALAAVGVAAFAVVVTRSAQRPPATTPPGGREKDGRASAFQGHAIQPELVVLAATKQPPSAGNRKGRVKARADTGPAEVLLFRIRLPAPAWVYLFAVTQSSKPLRLWPEEGSEWHPAGEFEVSNDGSVLALDPRRLASDARLLLIAAPAALDRARLAGLPTEPAAIAAALPECGIDVVPVSGKPP